MSEATDKLNSALADLAAKGATKKNAHAAHDAADVAFADAYGVVNAEIATVQAEQAQIASDSNQPATVAAPAGE